MQYKYNVEILDSDLKVKKVEKFRTVKEISEAYQLDNQLITRIIKKPNPQKKHQQNSDIYAKLRISIIKQQLNV